MPQPNVKSDVNGPLTSDVERVFTLAATGKVTNGTT